MRTTARSLQALTPADRTWRVTTATRVFVLALSTGLVLSNGSWSTAGLTLLGLAVLAAIMSALDFDAMTALVMAPAAEALLAALLVATAESSGNHLALYLAVPPLVAGLRHGVVSTLNTVLAELVALLFVTAALSDLSESIVRLQTNFTWLVVGLGAGLLAVWQRPTKRDGEDEQTSYVIAHRLLGQLNEVAQRLPTGFDTSSIAHELCTEVNRHLRVSASSVLIATGTPSWVPLPQQGAPYDWPLVSSVAQQAVSINRPAQTVITTLEGESHFAAFPLRLSRHTGALLTQLTRPLEPSVLEEVQGFVDEHAVRIESAMLFDDIRSTATTEERNRLAREIHDGVAQEIASLGYLVDELTYAESASHRDAAVRLRTEITRIVGELRLSIFDLRHTIARGSTLGGAIADYVAQVEDRSGLRVHLQLDEEAHHLQPEMCSELLRIAQEAISNARKHSGGENIWVQLHADPSAVYLMVADDGTGGAATRDGHYGMHTMRERAARISAELSVRARSGGGTVVEASLKLKPECKGADYVHNGVAG